MSCIHPPGELGTVLSLATFFSSPTSEAKTVGGDLSTLRFFLPAPHASARLDCWGGVGLAFLGISKNFPVRAVRVSGCRHRRGRTECLLSVHESQACACGNTSARDEHTCWTRRVASVAQSCAELALRRNHHCQW